MCVSYGFFFFNQNTAYEMRISDWSSDVCSSDLPLSHRHRRCGRDKQFLGGGFAAACHLPIMPDAISAAKLPRRQVLDLLASGSDHIDTRWRGERKSDVEGKSVSVRVDLGGRRLVKEKRL